METWSYFSKGKGLTFVDEMDLHMDEFLINTKPFSGFEHKPFYGLGQNIQFTETNFTEMARKPLYSHGPGQEILTFQKEESGSSISNTFVESNGQSSSLIDLKLGRVTDFPRTLNMIEFRGEMSVVPDDFSVTLPPKPARTAQNQIATPICQVYGCNKDLSSSKDYHKRHKVCDVHSKTATVIVNGVEQRFCQQCSRFHLLVEFDDGKRSCRRRLAGHNKRRRKSHFHGLAGKSDRLQRSFQGVPGTPAKNPNFLSPDTYTGGILYAEGPELMNPSGRASPKLFLQTQGTDYRYFPNVPPSAAARDDNTSSCKASAFQELSSVASPLTSSATSRSALSLLSTKSQDSSSAYQLDAKNQNHGSMFRIEYPFQKSFTGTHTQSQFCLCSSKPSGSALPVQMLFQEPQLLDPNSSHSPERGSTVDLIQLSSYLRRVEKQRNSFNAFKHEDPTSPYFFHNGRGV